MIYFLLAEELDAVKVGYTSRDPSTRSAEIQIHCPCETRLIRSTAGSKDDELRLHLRWREHWIRGEWFRYSAIAEEVRRVHPPSATVSCSRCGKRRGTGLLEQLKLRGLSKIDPTLACPACSASSIRQAETHP